MSSDSSDLEGTPEIEVSDSQSYLCEPRKRDRVQEVSETDSDSVSVKSDSDSVIHYICNRKQQWFGHCVRLEHRRLPKIAIKSPSKIVQGSLLGRKEDLVARSTLG